MPNIEGEQTELELENLLFEQLRRQFHSDDIEDAFVRVHNDAQLYANLDERVKNKRRTIAK